jgi:hypothetical protein
MTADQLFYVHRRLGNQMPCRYYLDAKGDGSYSHVCLELYAPISGDGFIPPFGPRLVAELNEYGMVFRNQYFPDEFPFPAMEIMGAFAVSRFIAVRDQTERGGKI